jgi:hypothetical protein
MKNRLTYTESLNSFSVALDLGFRYLWWTFRLSIQHSQFCRVWTVFRYSISTYFLMKCYSTTIWKHAMIIRLWWEMFDWINESSLFKVHRKDSWFLLKCIIFLQNGCLCLLFTILPWNISKQAIIYMSISLWNIWLCPKYRRTSNQSLLATNWDYIIW